MWRFTGLLPDSRTKKHLKIQGVFDRGALEAMWWADVGDAFHLSRRLLCL
jgi:hypothetical protein